MSPERTFGHLVESKRTTRNGEPIGLVSGYLATWEPDTGGKFGIPDQFVRGAFTASLADHRARGDRQVRLKDHHGKTVGGFPIETVKEDARGLYGIGEVNLTTQEGRELFALVRQGVLSDFSVGFTALKDEIRGGVRLIHEAKLWEASIVDEPANQGARILEAKHQDRLLAAIRDDLRDCARELRDGRSALDRLAEKARALTRGPGPRPLQPGRARRVP
jgi:HK97 family phage prohead protease